MINLKRLKATLLISGLQQKDPPLFQVINQLIDALQEFVNTTTASLGPGGSSNTVINNTIFQLLNDLGDSGNGDSSIIPGPAGSNGTIGRDGLTIPGQDGIDGENQYLLIQSSIVDTYAVPLTNGNGEAPEIIFDSFGDVVMVTGIPT